MYLQFIIGDITKKVRKKVGKVLNQTPVENERGQKKFFAQKAENRLKLRRLPHNTNTI